MTAEDDAYAAEWFVPLEELGAEAGVAADHLRRLDVSNRLPLPGYVRMNGQQIVARDLLALTERAGGSMSCPRGFWREHVHQLVDELDALEPPFAPYDRLRAGGPVSRDRLIDEVRERFPLQTHVR